MKITNPAVFVTLILIAASGVLMLAAHQADEGGDRRAGLVYLSLALAALVAAVLGPLTVLGILVVLALYFALAGLPGGAAFLAFRRLRRHLRSSRRPARLP